MFTLSNVFRRSDFSGRRLGIAASLALLGTMSVVELSVAAPSTSDRTKPTVVLVHGAFAESASWNGVAARLAKQGFHVIAATNQLRSVKGDAAYVASVLRSVAGPVVLVGHSYGGSVISAAALGNAQVVALVYVAAFAPAKGETAAELSGRFPGGTLGTALAAPTTLPDGSKELNIRQESFHDQFAADVPAADALLMAITQRPIAEAALGEASDEPAWRTIPSWFVYGTADRNIPAAAHQFMADRAKSVKTVAVPGASHVVMVSHPETVSNLIAEAAKSKVAP